MAKLDPTKGMTKAQLAYETRRAKKAGLSLEAWLGRKQRAEAQEQAERARAVAPAPVKKPGLLARLIERAHKPL